MLFLVFERLWGKVPSDMREVNVTPISKKGKQENLCYCRLVNPTSVTGQVMKEICLIVIFRHMKEKMVTGNIKNGFNKCKPYLTSPIVLYDV